METGRLTTYEFYALAHHGMHSIDELILLC